MPDETDALRRRIRELEALLARESAERLRRQEEAEATRLELQRAMALAQKQASLGTMAGGIAHNFNNLLMVVLGNLDLAEAPDMPAEEVGDLIRAAAGAAREAAKLSETMVVYAGRGMRRRGGLVPLHQALDDILPLVRATVPRHVQLQVEWPSTALAAHLTAEELQQVVVNLVQNSVEAIGDSPGRIELALLVPTPTEREANPAADVTVCLQVRDTGHGMDDATQARIFDPFFSTRMTGRGLGLSVTLGLVQAAGGRIEVESQPSQGTTVRVHLPASVSATAGTSPSSL